MTKQILRIENITKKFGEVVANDNICLHVNKGEVLALVGENGAGKSTLMNMISGIYLPTSGNIYIDEEKVAITSSNKAKELGVGMIYQRFKLINTMTGLQNILIGQEKKLFINKNNHLKKLNELMNDYDIHLDVSKFVNDMSIGEKQVLSIIKILYIGADLLIFDEPTTVLTPDETQKLFSIINNLKNKGKAIIFISHKLNEILEIADRVSVLHRGKTVVESEDIKNCTAEKLTEMMVGQPMDLNIPRFQPLGNDLLLAFKNVTVTNKMGRKALNDVSFELFKGEILGVAGISGNGQKPLCESIVGIQKIDSGKIILKGQEIQNKNVRDIQLNFCKYAYIPEDRLGMGLIPSMSLTNNVLLREYINERFILNKKPSEKLTEEIIKNFEVKATGIDQKTSLMSGGNIQKLLLGRELQNNPELIIASYPVRGLDIETTHKIYDICNEQKRKGCGIIYVAEDLDSLIGLCDRILVLAEGRISKILAARVTSKEEIGKYMLSSGGDTIV